MADFGLIETIKIANGRPVFKNYHVSRLHSGLQLLKVPISIFHLEDRILRLLKYECLYKGLKNIRLRLEVQKNKAWEYTPDSSALKWNCTIKPLMQSYYKLNEKPLNIVLYTKYKKPIDIFANLKHTDRELYSKAMAYAKLQDADDAILFNEQNRVADACIYNIFVVKNKQIITPPLSDAPVAGVLRSVLLDKLKDYTILQQSLSREDILTADELFFTNALRGIQTVGSIEGRILQNDVTLSVFQSFQTILKEHFGEDLVE